MSKLPKTKIHAELSDNEEYASEKYLEDLRNIIPAFEYFEENCKLFVNLDNEIDILKKKLKSKKNLFSWKNFFAYFLAATAVVELFVFLFSALFPDIAKYFVPPVVLIALFIIKVYYEANKYPEIEKIDKGILSGKESQLREIAEKYDDLYLGIMPVILADILSDNNSSEYIKYYKDKKVLMPEVCSSYLLGFIYEGIYREVFENISDGICEINRLTTVKRTEKEQIKMNEKIEEEIIKGQIFLAIVKRADNILTEKGDT